MKQDKIEIKEEERKTQCYEVAIKRGEVFTSIELSERSLVWRARRRSSALAFKASTSASNFP